jgi:hypothetical protein
MKVWRHDGLPEDVPMQIIHRRLAVYVWHAAGAKRVRRPGRTGGEINPIRWARSYLYLAEGLDHSVAERIGVESKEHALAQVVVAEPARGRSPP